MQFKPFAARHLGVFGGKVVHQFAEGERGDIGLDHAGIEFGNIHQGAQQVFHILQRVADISHQVGTVLRLAALKQRAGEQPRRIQRLQQVVADCSEEFGFRQVGLFGLALGLAQARLGPATLLDLT
ncbi:hypothetical protein D3C76_916870 [compost metagenome]